MAQTNPILDAASSLEAVKKAQRSSSEQLAQTRTDIQTGIERADEISDVMMGAVRDVSMADQIISLTAENADLKAQNTTINVFKASGGAEAQVERMERLVVDSARVEELLNKKSDIVDDEFTGIGLIDSAINEIRSVRVDSQINAAVQERNQTVSEISNISAATESANVTNSITRETLNSASIESGQKRIASVATLDGARLELENIHSNASSMSALSSADARFVENLISVYRLEGEAESRAFQTEQIKFERERLEIRKASLPKEVELADINLESARLNLESSKALGPAKQAAALNSFESAVEDRRLVEAERSAIVDQVQRGQQLTLGSNEDAATILFGIEQPGIVGEAYARLFLAGTNKTNPVIGSTPSEANNTLLLVDPNSNAKRTKAINTIYNIRNVLTNRYAASPTGAPRDQATLDANFNSEAVNYIAPYIQEIKLGDNSNPFQAPPMATLTSNSSVTRSALYRKILRPMSMQETNHERIMEAAVNGFVSGTISSEEAAQGITDMFNTAAAYNSTFEGGLERVGLGRQTTYNVLIPAPESFFNKLQAFVIRSVAPGIPFDPRKGPAAEALVRTTTDILDPTLMEVNLMDLSEVQQYIVRFSTSVNPDPNPDTGDQ